jgi:hypothetical protein
MLQTAGNAELISAAELCHDREAELRACMEAASHRKPVQEYKAVIAASDVILQAAKERNIREEHVELVK